MCMYQSLLKSAHLGLPAYCSVNLELCWLSTPVYSRWSALRGDTLCVSANSIDRPLVWNARLYWFSQPRQSVGISECIVPYSED